MYDRDGKDEAALPQISKAQYMANLSLSECEANVSYLTECLTDFFSGCKPTDDGCPAFFESQSCDGTMVLHQAAAGPCGIRVE